ncbi:MAG: hypothetical protein ACJAWV_004474 [Flammeovirgaceae bacterium]|jgi:hypothetical protein
MNIIETIRSAIEKKSHFQITDSNELFIKEDQNTGVKELKEVKITGLDSENTFAFKFDCFAKSSSYLSNKLKAIHKGCDCVIFHLDGSRLRVLICELKSFQFNRKADLNPKYEATRIWVDYFRELLKSLELADFTIEYDYFLFYLNKNKKRVRASIPYSWEESRKYKNITFVNEISKSSPKNFALHINQLLK